MTTEVSYPHVEKLDGDVARLKHWPRIRVAQLVMDYLAHGWSPDEICRQYPYLSLAEAHAAMTYYYDHEIEINNEIDHELAEVDQLATNGERSPVIQRLRLLKGR